MMKGMAMLAVLATGLAACSEGSDVTGANAAAMRGPTLVDVALQVNGETGEFSTLIAALVAADLVDAIAAPGQRTVFAPTDEAFAAAGLNAGNIGTLPKDVLTNILLYHVSPGRRDAASVLATPRLRMQNRSFTTISLRGGVPYINDAPIVATDVMASNGIIHVIGGVLLPE